MTRPPEPQRPRIPRIGLLLIYPGILLGLLYVTIFLIGNSQAVSQLAQNALNSAIPGRFVFGEVRLSASLTRVDVFGLELYQHVPIRPLRSPSELRRGETLIDLLPRPPHASARHRVLNVPHVQATMAPWSLLLGEIVVRKALLHSPQVLVSVDHKGGVGLPEALTSLASSDPRQRGRGSPPPDIYVGQIQFRNAEVLVHIADGLSVRLDDIEIDNASFALINDSPIIHADLRAAGGQLVALPELFDLVDVRSSTALRRYRRHRRVSPWGATTDQWVEQLRPRYNGEYGALVAPLGNVEVQAFTWENDAFTLGHFELDLAGAPVQGRGRLALSDDKQADIVYSLQAELELPPTHPLITFFADDLLAPLGDPEPGESRRPRASLDVAVEGDLAAIAGDVLLELKRVSLAGYPIEYLSLPLTTARGGRFETVGDGLRLEVGDGLAQGGVWLDPADGTYGVELWLDELPSQWVLRPLAADLDPEVIGGTFSTVPASPDDLALPGLWVTGELDVKTLGDFVAARHLSLATLAGDGGVDLPSRSAPRPPLAVVQFGDLTWDRAAPAFVNTRLVRATGAAVLSQDGRLTLSADGSGGRLNLDMGRESLAVRGSVDLLTETLDGLRVNGATSSLARLLDSPGLGRRATANIRLNGPFSDPRVRVVSFTASDLDLDGVTVAELETSADIAVSAAGLPRVSGGRIDVRDVETEPLSISRATATYGFDDGELDIAESSIETDWGKVDVEGRVGLLRDDGSFRSEPLLDLIVSAGALDLGAILPDLAVAGSAEVEATVRGTPSHPRVEGRISARDAIALDEWIDTLDAQVAYSDSGLDIRQLTIDTAGGRLEASGSFDSAFVPRSGRLDVEGFDLSHFRFLSELPIAITGSPEIHLELIPHDDVTAPAHIPSIRPSDGYPDLQGSIVVRDLGIAGTSAGVVALVLDTRDEAVIARGRLFHELETEIRWPLDDGPIDFNARFDRVWLGGIGDEEAGAESQEAAPDADDHDEDDDETETVLRSAGRSRGEILGGEINAELRLGETSDVVADLSIGEIWYEIADRRFETARPIHVSYALTPGPVGDDGADGALGHYLSIDELSFGSDSHFLDVSGGIRDWDTLNITVTGEAPLSVLGALDAIAEARGLVGVDIRIEGSILDPAPVGQVGFFNAVVIPRGLPDPITIDQGRIQLLEPEIDPDTERATQVLRIDRNRPLEGQLFGGAYTLGGQAQLVGLSPTQAVLDLDATAVTYQLPGEATVTLSRAALTLTAENLDGEGPVDLYLAGNAYVEEGLYFKDYGGETVVAGTVVGLFRREGVERYRTPIWEDVPALADLEFNVRVQSPDSFRVRNSVLGARVDVELRVDLLLTGTLASPRLSGEIDVIDGAITFQNRTFTVQDCRLSFEERRTVDGMPMPTIDNCVAEANIEVYGTQQFNNTLSSTIEDFSLDEEDTVNAYTVRVTVAGQPPNELDLTLESVNASLDQRDILALIFTGQTFDTLTTASGAGQPGLELVTAELLSFARSYLQETLSVDEIVVTPSTSGDGTVIQVSDRISRRLSLDVDATILSDEENQQSVRGQVTLFDWMLLEVFGSSDPENNIEGGGRIRLRFEL